MKNCLGKDPTITMDGKGLWRAFINSKKAFSWLKRIFEFNRKQSSWQIPSFVIGNEEREKSFVSGFFDSEGSITEVKSKYKYKEVRIHFSQANKKVLEKLKFLIEKFGIKYGKVCGPYIKKGSDTKMYCLIIHGKNKCLQFYKTFGSLHPEKILKFNSLCGDKDSTVVSTRSVPT